MQTRTLESVMADRLANVVKSPNDPREYRVIHLENGLTALLISDTHSAIHSAHTNSNLSTTDDDDDVEDPGSDEIEDESDDDDVDGVFSKDADVTVTGGSEEEKDESEDTSRKYNDTNMSAAALCIGVGSFSDPDNIPGLAHFLEHMVFMGSEKYPDENEFDVFIKKHGGSGNAHTDCERTTFVFNVRRKYFKETLERFAQFFISPLLKEDTVEREIQAVDSEYKMKYQSDFVRKMQLLSLLVQEGHPFGKFHWGNEETLKNTPEEKGVDVKKSLRDFQQRMYSAQFMTLAVISEEPLYDLEKMVCESFSQIPNNKMTKPSFHEFINPFDHAKFHKLCKMVPVEDVNHLEITWVLPPQQQNYRVKPMYYVSWLMAHEGPGSILSCLIKRCHQMNGEAVLDLLVGSFLFLQRMSALTLPHNHLKSETFHEQLSQLPSKTSPFYVNDVTFAVMSSDSSSAQLPLHCFMLPLTVGGLRSFVTYKWIKIYCNIVIHVIMLRNLLNIYMQLYPVEDFLTGDQLMWELTNNEQVIEDVQNLLTPDRANILILSKKYQEECTENEPWFQTPYNFSDISPLWLEKWKNLDLNPELYFPEENKFIATDFEIKDSDSTISEFPEIVHDSALGKVWYLKDTKFKTPRARFYFHIMSPLINASPESLVLCDLFLSVLEDDLKEIAYDANVAQLRYSMTVAETGIVLKLDGFNHKLALLFETIIDHIANFTATSQIFEMVKVRRISSLKYFYLITGGLFKISSLVRSIWLSILQHIKWTTVNKLSVIPDVTLENLQDFVSGFKSKLFVESLIQGNITCQEAISLQQQLNSKLQFMALNSSFHPEVRSHYLPPSECICRVMSFNKEDDNTIVTNYFQSGPASVEENTKMELMLMRMEEPCFDVLRTREQLGYSVFCTCGNTFGILGFSVTVQTQATKFSAEHVDSRIDAFLEEFGAKLSSMTEEDFSSQVDSLIELKEHKDLTLAEEADRNSTEIRDQTYLFDRKKREVESLRKLSKEDIYQWFVSHFKGGKNYKN
ncbi:nardilysin-like [Acropora muricata]|uniref:nardilysin-like n=1 Tax=Acropora muricata TaxID=159855 RepID=UPI0034E4FAB5